MGKLFREPSAFSRGISPGLALNDLKRGSTRLSLPNPLDEYRHPCHGMFGSASVDSGNFTDRQVFRLLGVTVYKDRMPPKEFTDRVSAFIKTVDFYQLDAVSEAKVKECLQLLLIATRICERQSIPGSMAVRADLQSLLINPSRRDFEYERFFKNVEKMLAAAEKKMTATEAQPVAQL